MAWMWLGVRPIMRLASEPTANSRLSLLLTATTDGSLSTMPLTAHVHQGVGRPKIHGHIPAEGAGEAVTRHELGLQLRGSEVSLAGV